jgi:pimeloyl-ACP methyl ester carboxylesterase
MKKMIVYFHGYGSSRNSPKVDRLKQEKDFNVFAFHIPIDPEVAAKQLVENIDMALIEDLHKPEDLVFVGTSLGGWWAGRMAKLYQCKAVIINPSIDPGVSLAKYGVSPEILNKYYLFPPYIGHKYFFAKNDEIIDNETFRNNLIESGHDVTVDDKANHRFDGDSFEKVVSYLKTL